MSFISGTLEVMKFIESRWEYLALFSSSDAFYSCYISPHSIPRFVDICELEADTEDTCIGMEFVLRIDKDKEIKDIGRKGEWLYFTEIKLNWEND